MNKNELIEYIKQAVDNHVECSDIMDIMNEDGWKLSGSGIHTDCYTNDNCNWVILISGDDCKRVMARHSLDFIVEVVEVSYLKCLDEIIYIAQKIDIILDDCGVGDIDELADMDECNEENFEIIKRLYILWDEGEHFESKDELVEVFKPLVEYLPKKLIDELIFIGIELLEEYADTYYCDFHFGNIGLIDDKVIIIDPFS